MSILVQTLCQSTDDLIAIFALPAAPPALQRGVTAENSPFADPSPAKGDSAQYDVIS